jgi:hypothetical protein
VELPPSLLLLLMLWLLVPSRADADDDGTVQLH